MQLEDHAGDVAGKARRGLQISLGKAARAAGIGEEALERFEKEGTFSPGMDFGRLAGLLGLEGGRLERLAQGGSPLPPDMGPWPGLHRISGDEGGMMVHCYLVHDPVSGQAALFDTGWSVQPIRSLVEGLGAQLGHLFVTHSHHDHVAALSQVREAWPRIRLHGRCPGMPEDQLLKEGEAFQAGSLRIAWRETSGHAEDGTTYLVEGAGPGAPLAAMVGDAIFDSSMGGAPRRYEHARRRVRQEILSLPGDTLICPGHGPMTTVEEQLRRNPFFPGAA